MDFGLAKVVEDNKKTTIVAGTPLYMPIEQAMGRSMDHRADIFSLGVTFFEMLTGGYPYPNGIFSLPEDQPAPSAKSLNPGVPRGLDRIINRMIQRMPEDRYPDARSVHALIKKFIDQVEIVRLSKKT